MKNENKTELVVYQLDLMNKTTNKVVTTVKVYARDFNDLSVKMDAMTNNLRLKDHYYKRA